MTHPVRITDVTTVDLRFPTAGDQGVSDAMNLDPDYSAAYLILHTDRPELEGHGFTFTIGRGNDIVLETIAQMAARLPGLAVADMEREMPRVVAELAADSHMRWLGPEKGVTQLASAAVLNALWDLWAKHAGMPLWQLLVTLEPEALVGCLDFRHVQDAITPQEAVAKLAAGRATHAERLAVPQERGYPAYITSAGWLGYDDARVRELVLAGQAEGWRPLQAQGRRRHRPRPAAGFDGARADGPRRPPDARRQPGVGGRRGDRGDGAARRLRPVLDRGADEPDDVLGHARIARAIDPIKVATGEHVHNRVMFKQFLEAGAMGFCQADSCRLASVNENLIVYLMAAKHGVPVCPHAGGVGLCELVQHLSIADYLLVSETLEGRMTEYVDHLHAAYVVPTQPGYSSEIVPEVLASHAFPGGAAWV